MKNIFRQIQGTLSAMLCTITLLGAQNKTETVILDDFGMQNLGIQTVVAEEQTFEKTLFAIGRIEDIPANHAVVSTRIAGRVVSLNVYEGDSVEAGQVIARIESRQPGDPPPQIELKAPQAGLVIESHIRLGQPVEPNTELMDISDRRQMWAIAQIPEQEAAKIKIGTQARIQIPAIGDAATEATLLRFGITADRQAGTVAAIFQVDNSAGKLQPGMRSEFNLIVSQRKNVLAIPRAALQGPAARQVVFVKDFDLPNVFLKVPVIIGEQNDTWVEILSGLFHGDDVVTQGSYALNFAGSGSGISLKEALDAAHGHEHNEDGSEITEAQKAARKAEAKTGDEHGHSHHNGPLWRQPLPLYAAVMTALFIIAAQLLWRKSKKTQSPDHA